MESSMRGAIVGDYRVDPDRVIGVLASVDDAGAGIADAISGIDALALEGGSLSVDGRRTLSAAWGDFLEERRLVPGKLAHIVASSATAVTEATTAVVAGDVEMSVTAGEAESRALDDWGIDSLDAYTSGVYG
ncbi:hypothetical protein NS220_09390 [Microbacterium testaceum]|uniref:Uncharacterized protein n=2 Tax=Microbacterium testaceum TaxID=2033 RepID=A0A147EXR4_MICTE|nr:hypothetical protein NS220_09390 [Microbacterium testaceum]